MAHATDRCHCSLAPLILVCLSAPAPLPKPVTAYLGAELRADSAGLTISGVYVSSPAFEAGLVISDVIVTLDDEQIRTPASLAAFLRRKKPGDLITAVVQRNGRETKLQVKLGERRPHAYLGITQSNLLIRSLLAESPAGKAGLMVNDRIVAIDDIRLMTPQDLMTVLSARKCGDSIQVMVQRGGMEVKVPVKLGERPGY